MGMRASPCSPLSPCWCRRSRDTGVTHRKIGARKEAQCRPHGLVEVRPNIAALEIMFKRTDSVNGEHGGATVKICERLDGGVLRSPQPPWWAKRVEKVKWPPSLQKRSVERCSSRPAFEQDPHPRCPARPRQASVEQEHPIRNNARLSGGSLVGRDPARHCGKLSGTDSKTNLRCSAVILDGPLAAPRLALLMLLVNTLMCSENYSAGATLRDAQSPSVNDSESALQLFFGQQTTSWRFAQQKPWKQEEELPTPSPIRTSLINSGESKSDG